ncbi:DUF3108 domain-containing protein [Thalassomonas sp. M1454]|uniref:DUF3108 domain-containing protein n=1 Tax=Thalassomonas sp. M1454 TaxID=2594477 RepID=UPI00117FBE5F|nr:DUF3108 domain-containing protein [Thalassomonas sp. M1454]TRX57001.1 DUF3108 domain-containing protein [Thalassomonas sp. M1454]
MSNTLYLKAINFVIASSLCLLSTTSTAKEAINKIDDFTAKYNIIHDGDIVGKAVRILKNLPDGSVEFSYKTDIEWLIFSDHRKEFTTNKIINGNVIPLSYKSDREGTGKDKYYHWSFDAEAKTATNLKKKTPQAKAIDWPEGLQSKLSYHLQSRFNLINDRKNFSFDVISTKGRIGNYTYKYLGEENIMTPYGNLDTVKLQRKKPGKDQITTVWFAPKLDYLMVRLHQIESDFKQVHAELVSIETP